MKNLFSKCKTQFVLLASALLVSNPLGQFVSADVAKPNKFLGGDNADPSAVGTKLTGGTAPLPVVVGNMINVLISVLGIIFVVLIVYAGYLYLTAAGDKEKVNKAKTLLGQSVLGMIIILAAYSIATFVIGQLGGITAT